MRRLVPAAVAFLLAFAAAAHAKDAVFMGLNWGDDPETVASVLPITQIDDPLRQEIWVHDASLGDQFIGSLGTIRIESISFSFFDGQLYDITVRLPDIVQHNEAYQVLERRYGKPRKDTIPIVALSYWIWDGEDTRIEMPVSGSHWFKFFNPSLSRAHMEWRDAQRDKPAW